MKVLLIEDELRARRHMEKLLTTHFPEVEVAGAVGSVRDTVQWLASHPAPDLIFMDVELSDGSSFEIFKQTDVHSPVVMTTAYDQYAVQAFAVRAVDYLLKPIELPDLQRAIARVTSGIGPKNGPEGGLQGGVAQGGVAQGGFQGGVAQAGGGSQEARKEKFLIRLNDRIVPVRTSDIAYFYSEAKTTYIVTTPGFSYVLDDSLDALEETLDPDAFFRISRGCIISESVIESVSKLMGGRLQISLRQNYPANTDFTVSRARVEEFLHWLEK